MRAQQEKTDTRIFIFKVTEWIGKIRGSPYRDLAIPEDFTLYRFAEEITGSFDFCLDHPFGFYNHLTRYYDATEAYELFADDPDTRLECPSFAKGVKKTRVNTVFIETGKKMLFLFDYGENWQFRVELTSIETAQQGKPYPTCIKSVGKARAQYDEPDELD
jgi:hypothetical protein